MPTITRPDPSEYAAFYRRYVDGVPDGDILATLRRQGDETLGMFRDLDEPRALHRYAPGKWSLKELLGHVIDTERIFAYRAMRFARGDRTPLPGFEQDDYIGPGRFDARPTIDLAGEFDATRAATIALFSGLPAEAVARSGVASGNPMTVRAIAWIIAGHERHHVRIATEKYLT